MRASSDIEIDFDAILVAIEQNAFFVEEPPENTHLLSSREIDSLFRDIEELS